VEPVFGVVINRPDTEPQPIVGADFSKIGIVTSSDDADAGQFPLGVAVRFNSRDPAFVSAAKIGTGFLADAVRGINDQLAGVGGSADIIAVRVDHNATMSISHQNVIDGLAVLRACPPILAATPRIVLCPGYTSQVESVGGSVSVSRAAKTGGNTGQGAMTLAGTPHLSGVKAGVYEVRFTGGAKSAAAVADGDNAGDGTVGSLTADTDAPVGAWTLRCVIAAANGGTFAVIKPNGDLDGAAVVGQAYNGTDGINFTIADGDDDFEVGDEFTVAVAHSIPSGGGTFSVTDPDGNAVGTGSVGNAFANQIAFTIADGTPDFIVGDGFDVTVAITDATITANPVVAALPEVLGALRAVAFVDTPDTSMNAAVNWRETVNSDRIIPVGVSVKVLESAQYVDRPASPRIAGLCIAVDNQFGGKPFNPIANRPIYGIVGTNRVVPFSISDGAVEGQQMLAADIGIIVRGEVGVDAAIADGGFVYVGFNSCAEGELWAQFHQVRGADYLAVKIERAARPFLGKALTVLTAEAWLLTVKFMLRDHKAAGDILGYDIVFDPEKNSPEEVRLGHLTVTPKIEPAPVFTLARHEVLRYRPAIEEFISTLAARLTATV
jgi:phage tail sheath protein FI